MTLLRFVLLLSVPLLSSTVGGAEVELGVALEGRRTVAVSLRRHGRLAVESVQLYRSTSALDGDIDTIARPVTVLRFPDEGPEAELVDSMVADNVSYYYRARVCRERQPDLWSNVDSVRVPDRRLGRITGSSLLVDKVHYFLEVRDGGMVKKRYPVALGASPRSRKLHMDRASTPEGIYRITGEQPDATFYKAFDIDYPNAVDRARYAFAQEAGLMEREWGDYPVIGGEIQIHGEGIGRNWTWGCIALRNEDIDELFEHDRVGKGMPVYIVGPELTREDIAAIQDYRPPQDVEAIQRSLRRLGHYRKDPDGVVGTGTRLALGRFQRAHGLAPTCDFDARTVPLLRGD